MNENKLQRIWFEMEELEELMVITMEECGELIQACSKAIRTQDYTRDDLKDEVGDVLCMIELMKEKGLVNGRELRNQVELKKLKLVQWSKLIK